MLKVVEPPVAQDRPPVVLFVDDEPRVLTSMRALFRKGYQVRTANSATEALAVLADQPVDLIVSDQRMPHMTGVELLARVRREFPQTRRILLTGYADLTAIESALNECEVARYLVKPCPPDELRAAAAAVLAQPTDVDIMEPALTDAAADESPTAMLADVVVLNAERAVEQRLEQPPEPSTAESQQQPEKAVVRRADVLVLTEDGALTDALTKVVASLPADSDAELPAGQPVAAAHCHVVSTLSAARSVLTEHPVGVVVTDTVLDAGALVTLKEQLLHGGFRTALHSGGGSRRCGTSHRTDQRRLDLPLSAEAGGQWSMPPVAAFRAPTVRGTAVFAATELPKTNALPSDAAQ